MMVVMEERLGCHHHWWQPGPCLLQHGSTKAKDLVIRVVTAKVKNRAVILPPEIASLMQVAIFHTANMVAVWDRHRSPFGAARLRPRARTGPQMEIAITAPTGNYRTPAAAVVAVAAAGRQRFKVDLVDVA
jgi:hypothetical protein